MKTSAFAVLCFAAFTSGMGFAQPADARPEVDLIATNAAARADGWRALFNGKDLDGWETFLAKPHASWDVPGVKRETDGRYLEAIGLNKDPLKVFTVATVDGGAVLHVSGQGFGTITTKESFGNYHLRLEVKWGERKWAPRANAVRDCGLLYFVHGPLDFDHGMWPRSIEFQIQERDFGDLYAIAAQTTVPARKDVDAKGRSIYLYDPAGEKTPFLQQRPIGNRCVRSVDAEKPLGEWNTLELICIDGDSIHIVNGKVVMRLYNAQRLDGAAPAPLASGQISLQTEGAEVYYRNVEIRPIKEVPAEWR